MEPTHSGVSVAQGMLPSPFCFQGAIAKQVQDPICWRRKRVQRRHGHLREDCLGIPLGRPDHPQDDPIRQGQRQIGHEAFERAFPQCPNQGDDQPAEDQKRVRLRAAEMPPARIQNLICLAGCMCGPTCVLLLDVLGCWLHPAYPGALLFSGVFTHPILSKGLRTCHF
jgi:hypothetical protein